MTLNSSRLTGRHNSYPYLKYFASNHKGFRLSILFICNIMNLNYTFLYLQYHVTNHPTTRYPKSTPTSDLGQNSKHCVWNLWVEKVQLLS